MKAIRIIDNEWKGTKEEAKAIVQLIADYWQDKTYYSHHGEYCRPEFKTVRTKEGWAILKRSFFYYGTLYNGFMIHDGVFEKYLDMYEVQDLKERMGK